ncbi:T9SS type A sorting domain-containing protein [Sunxiuqinia sp. A32]|uniref:T9SS type A sorting domain-containing protein n=1 Tax=Sunxiuqinia sp. A32 TaxID=3461496 RepID=UPI0040465712
MNKMYFDKYLYVFKMCTFSLLFKKLQPLCKWAAAFFLLLSFHSQLYSQELVFEAEEAILSNGASIQDASECSEGKQVGNLGGAQNGSVTEIFQVSSGGDYDLVLSYCTADQRSFSVWVNYGKRLEVVCPPSGGWSTPKTTQVQITLVSGQNTLIFDNPNGWAPNLDQFSLTPSPSFDISGKVEDNGVGVSNVILSLSGAKTASVVSDESGYYSFSGLTSGKDYTVTPSKNGNVFTPSYISYEPLAEEKIDQNFQALPVCEGCIEKLSFGVDGELQYSTQTGTFSVLYGGLKVISSAYSLVYDSDAQINSMDYSNRQVAIEDIDDDFGSGQKLVVSLTANGMPEMQQIFYAYAGKDYFLTEVALKGENVSSNYIAPVVTNEVDIAEVGDNRFLSVPFDNDGFIRYKSHSFESYAQATSSEVTAFYDDHSRKGLVVGSVEHMVWKTGIKGSGVANELTSLTVWGGYSDENVTRDTKAHGVISGEEIKSPKMFVGYFDDWRIGLEEYGKANAIAEPRYVFDWDKPTPFGWNSWGSIQTDLSLDKAKAVVDFFAQSLPKFRNGETAYIDLDSFWDNMVPGGLEGDFSNLTTFANYCKSKGLKPGIYWGPFVDWGKYNRLVEGSVYSYASTWIKVNGAYHDVDGGRAMDPTHPATQARIKYLIDKLIACGFEMIKIDFIAHGAVEADHYYDPEVTTGMQAYRKGMEYLVDQLSGKMLIYAAISPNMATARYVHSRRIACDAYSDIGATGYTLNSNTYGWWQDQMYNFIDGDHIVFGNSSVGENRARLASGLINGMLINGDDFSTLGQWTDRAKSLLQNEEILDVARDGVAFRPVDGDSENGASEIFTKESENGYDVIIVNYGTAKTFDLNFDRLGIEGADYGIKELFTGQQITYDGTSFSVDVPTRDAMVLKLSKGFPDDVDDISTESAIQVFPNPTKDKLFIRSEDLIDEVRLYSSSGLLVNSLNQIYQKEAVVDMVKYREGGYLVTISMNNGSFSTHKIIKTH